MESFKGKKGRMHITIAAVGKVREPYLQQGIEEYLKRLAGMPPSPSSKRRKSRRRRRSPPPSRRR